MNKIFKKLSILGLFILALNLVPQISNAQSKSAIVNLQRALSEVNEGKRAMAKIKSKKESLQKQLESVAKGIQDELTEIEKKKNVLSKEALQAKYQEIQTKRVEFQKQAVESESEIRELESESIKKIITSLRDVVLDISKREKYDMVYENSGGIILYTTTAEDITDKIIKEYNKKNK